MKKYLLFGFLTILSLSFVSCNKEKVEPTYSVTFDLQGKGSPIETISVENGSLITKPSNPIDEQYFFIGWYKDAENTDAWDFDVDKVTKNLTLYAKWERKCIIIYNTKYSGITIPNDTLGNGSLATRPSDPERNGYKIIGWYKDEKYTQQWDFKKDSVTQAQTTLYAKWAEYKYYGAELYSNETFKYGRFEAKMKMAFASGCVSSMFLYYNDSWKGNGKIWNEIDIEVLGKDETGFQSNIITGSAESRTMSETMHKTSTPPDSEYHTYLIEWTPEHVLWIVDGKVLRETKLGAAKEQVEDLVEKQSLRFNLWIPNTNVGWVGEFKSKNLPIMQYIDYVKVSDYNVETKEFTERWTDDFDSFNSSRWSKGDWQMEQVMERKNNVVVEDGNLVLKLTKE